MRFEHLYIHVPFCARRCVYCDFSIAVRTTIPVSAYLESLAAELRLRHARSTLDLDTVYLGGGTPSKLGADGVARLLDLVRLHADIRPGAEVTIEVNPEDVTPEATRAWLAAGVNRLSIGVQSFSDPVLAWMHRTHDAAGAKRAVEVARAAGAENLSVDLIFAVPVSLQRDWRRDLDAALGLRLPHLSVYGLTVEERTPLGKWVARRRVAEAPEETFAREFLDAHSVLTAAGLTHYEVSNYAVPGLQSRHNLAYWRRVPYVGVGPSAHEFDGETRRWNLDAFAAWTAANVAAADPIAGSERLQPSDVAAEEAYLGLRTTTGIAVADKQRPAVASWVAAGWMVGDSTRVRLTPDGWLRLDSIASALTPVRSRY